MAAAANDARGSSYECSTLIVIGFQSLVFRASTDCEEARHR